MDLVRVSDKLAYCEQPSFQALRGLRKRGFHTVVNARLPGEQLSDEETNALRVGLTYLQFPVAQRHWSLEVFDRFSALLHDQVPAPILVHSGQGARAGILCLTLHAARSGRTVEELEAQAQRLGLELPDAARAWLRQHGTAYRSQGQVDLWLRGGQLP
jgi:uncharacterized protein (TIGR01244 family)